MFYDDPTRVYSLLGVYRFERGGLEEKYEAGRTFSSLAFRLRGESAFTYGEKHCVADEKSIIYIPAGVDFSRIGGNEEMIVLHLKCHGEDDREITVLHADGVEEQFVKLLSDWETGGIGVRNRCLSRLYRILETVEKAKQMQQITPPDAILAGVEYLQTHYRDSDLTVTHLASLCHVSEVYFRRVYRECFDMSPWQRILELRFSYACTLLQSGYYTVKEIATLAGFSDVKYFRTAFGKWFGCTPTEYVKKG
ncbi:MAG: helix-turn-helix transcriptional regulator [Clostridia bacterium]|nr:helix-turn-helix transcriptional regulator [Clostridia bacterium]